MTAQKKKSILLTGASGFIGHHVLAGLLSRHYAVIAPVRSGSVLARHDDLTEVKISELQDINSSSLPLDGCEAVIHLAGKAHVTGIELDEFQRVNTDATVHLANEAAKSGVKRFIFISSIGVNGISNTTPFKADDRPAPEEPYAVSKLAAEMALKEIARQTGMEVVIIRPPLVYGPDAPGNFGKLLKLAKKNLPLPLGAIDNKRSLVALDNLVDLICLCITHPNAANQTFLVSDGQDVSTTELLKCMIRAHGKTPHLVPVPTSWLRLAARLLGKQAIVDRLCGSLQVDIQHTRQTLNWQPPVTLEQGIRQAIGGSGQ
ncbi:NAD-dependent epimerase/dehydratase family protein [Alkalimonas collagenimarina]|uniref:NAD-dependent epimerase/dehydratase family protein n=1 Tax=Alkalimonas collagenimarina TaxID=400390 RepID=A0ABT9H0T3_9GAMM|nr:NAD-dependent epimerase/dehydratase family protein [Alkalimonas collagenimarina]MDP4536913.1 NAD-dependent epimerase/dehydratase family protein [Alkalimonas collagenimarina]